MNKLFAAAGVGAAALGLAACSGTPHTTAAPAKTHKTSPAPSVVPSSSAPPTANPSGTGSGSCDYTLEPDVLTAEVDLTNTGNVGIVVRVTVKWPQEGFPPIRSTKTVHTPYKSSNVAVRFHVPVSDSGPVIDNLQSWVEGHDDPVNICTYKLKIIRSYGPVQGS